MNITFRPATHADHPFLWELHSASFKVYVEEIWGWDEAQQIEMFNARFNPENIKIIQLDGHDVGRLDVDYQAEEVFLSLIAIAPAFQGQSIGTHIIRNIIKHAHAENKAVSLRVLRPNPAQHLYKRLDFEVTQEDEIRRWMICRPSG